MAGNKVVVKFLADVDGINKGVAQVNQQLGGFEKGLKNVTGMVAGAFAVSKVLDFGAASITAASDLAEMESKVNQVFGASGKAALDQWAQSADTAMGLTQTAALDAASSFGIMGDKAGLSGDALVKFSEGFAQLAGDMASFSNTSVADALQAIQSGLRGEAEPLRKYGVLLDDATLKQAAMELGIYSGTGALTSQQKILAGQKAIFNQTSKAQGDFARTSDGLANQMRIVTAEAGNLQIVFGQSLLKGFGDTTDAAKNMSSVMDQAEPYVKQLGEEIGTLGGWAVTAAGYIIGLNDQITKLTAIGDNSTGFSFLQGSIGFLTDTIDRVRILAGVWTENQVATNEAKNALDGVDGTLQRTSDLAWSTSDAYTVAATNSNVLADQTAKLDAAAKQLTEDLKAQDAVMTAMSTRSNLLDYYANLDKAVGKNGDTLNENTKKGRANQAIVIEGWGLVQDSVVEYGKTHDATLTRIFSDQKTREFRKNLLAAGIKPQDADRFLAETAAWGPAWDRLATSAATAGGKIGRGLGDGMLAGMTSRERAIAAEGARLTAMAEEGARSQSQTRSPSQKWLKLGVDLMDGLDLGIKVGGEKVLKTVTDQMTAINDAAKKVIVTTWDAVGETVASSVDGVTLKVQGKHNEFLAVNEVAWTSRLNQFTTTTNQQLAIIKTAYDAIQSMSDSVTSQVLGGIKFDTVGADGKPLTPDQIVAGIFGDLSNVKEATMIIAGNIGAELPPALLSQILSMPPETQIALARYLGTHPEMLTQLALQYDALSIYTQEALGVPMGIAWATVGGESAISMIESAKATIAAESASFKNWVKSKLHTNINVDVTYNVTNPQSVISGVSAYESVNGTTWRV